MTYTDYAKTCVCKMVLSGKKTQDIKYHRYASTSMFKYTLMYTNRDQEKCEIIQSSYSVMTF